MENEIFLIKELNARAEYVPFGWVNTEDEAMKQCDKSTYFAAGKPQFTYVKLKKLSHENTKQT